MLIRQHCIDTARDNTKLNGVEDKCDIEMADLLSKNDKKGDIVFANITADILIRLSKDIKKYINDGGIIILSGIIHTRLDEVKQAYLDAGFKFLQHVRLGEWNALKFSAEI